MQTRPAPPERTPGSGTNGGADAVQRWRLVVRRDALPADLAQREQLSAWDVALAGSGLPIAGLDGPRPRPRLAIAAPLSAGIPGEAELVEVWLIERLPRWRVREALADRLPTGFHLVDLYDVWLGEPPLPGRVTASVYRATLPSVGAGRLTAAADVLLAASALPRERRRGEASVAYDLRPFLDGLEVEPLPGDGAAIRMTLRHDPAKGIGRPDETLAALGEVLGDGPLEPASLVRERLLLAEPPAPAPTAPQGARRPSPPPSASAARSRSPATDR